MLLVFSRLGGLNLANDVLPEPWVLGPLLCGARLYRAGIIKHRVFKPLFEDIYGMEIDFFSYRPIDTIELNFHDCSNSFLQT